MEYQHAVDCQLLLLRILYHPKFGVKKNLSWPYCKLEAEFTCESVPRWKNKEEMIEHLASVIDTSNSKSFDYYHVCSEDLRKDGLSFFDDWEFHEDKLKIKDWPYGVIVSSALLYLIRGTLETYVRGFMVSRHADVPITHFVPFNWLYLLHFCINEKIGPILGPLLIELDLINEPKYAIKTISFLMLWINTSPRYDAVLNYGCGTDSFIEEGLVNFLAIFKVNTAEAMTLAEKTVQTKSIVELTRFFKEYKLALEVKLTAEEFNISKENL